MLLVARGALQVGPVYLRAGISTDVDICVAFHAPAARPYVAHIHHGTLEMRVSLTFESLLIRFDGSGIGPHVGPSTHDSDALAYRRTGRTHGTPDRKRPPYFNETHSDC